MHAADIFVLPSSREGMSNALLEAMASGLAIVASDIPEITGSQITPRREGLLTPPGDEDAILQALQELVINIHLRCSLGKAARQRIEREFTYNVIDEQYIQVYKQVLLNA
jgi:glycosyltransferase involved in cell wall biosynthesis